MLKQENRLHKDADFKKVFKKSRPVFWQNLAFRSTLRPDAEHKPVRFGFIVSNKIDKRSTRRNALKRRLRVAVSELLPQIKSGHDIIIIVKQNFSYPYRLNEIRGQVFEGLRRAGIVK